MVTHFVWKVGYIARYRVHNAPKLETEAYQPIFQLVLHKHCENCWLYSSYHWDPCCQRELGRVPLYRRHLQFLDPKEMALQIGLLVIFSCNYVLLPFIRCWPAKCTRLTSLCSWRPKERSFHPFFMVITPANETTVPTIFASPRELLMYTTSILQSRWMRAKRSNCRWLSGEILYQMLNL